MAKFSALDPDLRTLTFVANQNELRFYQDIAPQVQLATPRLYYGAVDPDTGKTVLLLEDVSKARLGDPLAGCSAEEAKLVMREIAAFHATWWDSPRLDEYPWLPVINEQAFMSQEMYQHSWEMFTAKFGDRIPTPLQEVASQFGKHIVRIGNQLADRPLTLIHGDYHLQNLFFGSPAGGPPLTVIDWQLVTKGPGPVDVAYFLAFCLDPERRRREEMDLLKDYHDALVEKGVLGYGFEQCRYDYRLSMFRPLGVLVIAGAILDFTSARGEALASVLVQRVTAAMADHRMGELVAELSPT